MKPLASRPRLSPEAFRRLETWLREGQIDLAIGPVKARPPVRLHCLALAKVPLVLLVHRRSPIKTPVDLWSRKKVTNPLIGLPASTTVMRNFQRGLKRREVVWPQVVEATSVELVTRYVASGEGHGVSLRIADVTRHRDVRALPLEDFEPMIMGVLWRGEPSPIVRGAIDEVQRYSHETWPEWASEEA